LKDKKRTQVAEFAVGNNWENRLKIHDIIKKTLDFFSVGVSFEGLFSAMYAFFMVLSL